MAIMTTIGVRLLEIPVAASVTGAIVFQFSSAIKDLKIQLPSGRTTFHETT
jgi:hypothetical protein